MKKFKFLLLSTAVIFVMGCSGKKSMSENQTDEYGYSPDSEYYSGGYDYGSGDYSGSGYDYSSANYDYSSTNYDYASTNSTASTGEYQYSQDPYGVSDYSRGYGDGDYDQVQAQADADSEIFKELIEKAKAYGKFNEKRQYGHSDKHMKKVRSRDSRMFKR